MKGNTVKIEKLDHDLTDFKDRCSAWEKFLCNNIRILNAELAINL